MKTILIVDDDKQLRGLFSATLVRAGYHVMEAGSGVAGLAMARKHLPDLILSDVHMPGGDGSTLLRDIRGDAELKSKQVVLMTGRLDLITPRKGMEDGADDFLEKPVSLTALISCIAARFNRASINWRVEDVMLDKLRASVPAHIPHEFFTPLAGIIGLSEILLLDAATLSSIEVADLHRDIHKSALRLHRTLRNYLLILDFPTACDVPPRPLSSTEVTKSIHAGVREALRYNERAGDVTVTTEVGCSPAIKEEDLSRMVEELVDNACKFSRQGTSIKVEAGFNGRITISDVGRGLTQAEIERIGVFQQFDRKKYEQQGLGLGLVLVQKLTALYHNGQFLIHSREGEGTQVTLTFPSEAVPRSAQQNETSVGGVR